MPKSIEQLSQADIKQLIADAYGVDVTKVSIKITAPYYGSPLDSSPGDVCAEVERAATLPKRTQTTVR